MMVIGALADPKIGPDPTDSSFTDLLCEADDDGLKSNQQSHPTPIIVRAMNLDLTIEILTTLSFQTEC
jgi:hypothetical protein